MPKLIKPVAILLGDVTLNNKVDAEDLTMLARHVAKIEIMTDNQRLVNGDVDLSNLIDAVDLTKLARHVAKIEFIK